MRTHLQWIAVFLTILSVGCGGSASSPTSPSAVAPVASGAGNAVVTGTVRLGATAGVGSAADPMKVQVVGTDLTATVSLAGQFAIDNVPSGQIQLHFFGAGVDATISIGLVTTGETVTISVTVVGTSAVVESEARKAADQSEEQIEGRIESLPPTQAPGIFVVAGRTVTTTGATVFKLGSATVAFGDLAVGQRVHVKGTTAGAVFTASLVEIQNVQTDLPANVNGIVSGLTGSELAFQFMVDGRAVTGDHQTVFFGNGGMSTFTDLADGVRVEVKGQQQDAAIYAVRIHINLADDGDDDEDASQFEATGTVSARSGACPTLTFTLAGKIIATDATTQFKGAGCAGVIDGVKAEVDGVIQTDGSVKARKVDVDKDEIEFEAKGAIAGLTGTCPAITFTLAGKSVTTDASTQFKGGECRDIANGDEADVKGLTQADGTVKATRVETEKAKGKDDDDDDDDEGDGGTGAFESDGPITGLSGSCPAISFSLKGVGIDANAATVFDGVTCAALKNGDKVEVKGTKQTSGRVLATTIEK